MAVKKIPVKKGKKKGTNKEFIEQIIKPGEVRNPNGRPRKENTYSDTLRSLLEGQDIQVTWTINGKKKSLKVTSDKNIYYGIASAQIVEALKGNVMAQKEIVNRIQGKAPQYTEFFIPDEGKPLSDAERALLADSLDNNSA